MIRRYRVYFFLDQRDDSQVFDYMIGKNDKEFARIFQAIERLSYLGPDLLDTNMAKRIGKFFELKKDMHRIIYTNHNPGSFVLLHAFFKKTNETPVKEKNQAQRNYDELLLYGNIKEIEFPEDI